MSKSDRIAVAVWLVPLLAMVLTFVLTNGCAPSALERELQDIQLRLEALEYLTDRLSERKDQTAR